MGNASRVLLKVFLLSLIQQGRKRVRKPLSSKNPSTPTKPQRTADDQVQIRDCLSSSEVLVIT